MAEHQMMASALARCQAMLRACPSWAAWHAAGGSTAVNESVVIGEYVRPLTDWPSPLALLDLAGPQAAAMVRQQGSETFVRSGALGLMVFAKTAAAPPADDPDGQLAFCDRIDALLNDLAAAALASGWNLTEVVIGELARTDPKARAAELEGDWWMAGIGLRWGLG